MNTIFRITFSALLFLTVFASGAFSLAASPYDGEVPVPGGNGVLATANNECIGATPLTFNVPVSDNNTGATQSQPPNSCNFFIPASAKDVWFTFTYNLQMDSLVVSPPGNPDMDIAIELFSGACGALTFIGCSNFAEPNSNNQTEGIYLGALGLTVGSSYKLRVYAVQDVPASFTVLLKTGTGIMAPPNDQCSAPLVLSSGAAVLGTNIGATESIPAITCNGSTGSLARDVWYRFTKSASNDSLLVIPLGTTDMILEIRSNNCSAGTSVLCANSRGIAGREGISLASLTNGTQYLARVYGLNGSAGEFALRLKNGVVNNECGGALELLPGFVRTGTTLDATQSLPPAATCGGTSDDDVWFSFSMAAGYDSVIVEGTGLFDAVAELRSGPCTSSSFIRCANATQGFGKEKLYVGNLTEGNTYYVRVYSVGSGSLGVGSFTVRVTQAIQSPPNDECASPILLTGTGTTTGNNNNATQTLPAEACGGPGSQVVKDVWYRFVKTDLMDTLVADGFGSLDLLFDIRANSCPGGTVFACLDQEGFEGKKLPLDALNTGDTYLLRLYGREGTTGDFSLSFRDAVVVVDPPVNDNCSGAIVLSPSATCNPVSGTNNDASESQPTVAACAGSTPGIARDVWYSFTATSTRAIVKVSCGLGFDAIVQAYSGSCSLLQPLACVNSTGVTQEPGLEEKEELILTGLTSGQTYRVRIYGAAGGQGDFTVCVYDPNCNSPVPTLTSTAPSSLLSNQAFSVLSGGLGTGTGFYQFSVNQTNWNTFPIPASGPDTLTYASVVSGPVFLRLSGRTGSCYPSFSQVVNLNIRCATPFVLATVNNRINRIEFNTINQVSTRNPMGGNVQDFSAVSTQVCRGNTYNLTITANLPNTNCNRLAWIDFNQDGDFSDAGENVVNGPFVSGAALTYPVAIPASATPGTTRMRVAIINNGAPVNSTDPCAPGPYNAGEIEEYSVVITQGVVAAAGSDQVVCASQALLAGNNPGPGGTGAWSVVSGTGIFANASSFNTTVTGLSTGPNKFRWVVTGTCGTTADTVVITSASALTANAGINQTVCSATASLAATPAAGGTGSWTVFSGGGVVSNPSSPTSGVSNLAAGVNSFIWVVTPSAPGCPVARDTVQIFRKSAPTANGGTGQTLCSPNATLAAVAPAQGIGRWRRMTGAGLLADSTSPSSAVSGLGYGVNTFRWTVTDAPCAPVFAEINLTNNLPARPSSGPDLLLCGTTTSSVSAGTLPPGLSGTWSVLSGTATIAAPGQSSTTVSDVSLGVTRLRFSMPVPACGVTLSDTLVLNRENNPVNLGPDTTFCQEIIPTYTLLGPAGMQSYLWSPAPGATTQGLVVSSTSVYQLEVQTPAGCTFTDDVLVTFIICNSVADRANGFPEAIIRPNPASAAAASVLDIGREAGAGVSVQIFDARGSRVWESRTGQRQILLPGRLLPGLYQVRVQGEGRFSGLRWVVR